MKLMEEGRALPINLKDELEELGERCEVGPGPQCAGPRPPDPPSSCVGERARERVRESERERPFHAHKEAPGCCPAPRPVSLSLTLPGQCGRLTCVSMVI
jgi:hypothetical protein